MQLYLMQHGTCFSQEIDPEQPLSPVGREQVEKSGIAVRKMGIKPGAVLCSPKKRAVQTAEIIAQAVGFSISRIVQTEQLKAKAPSAGFLNFLKDYEKFETVFAAGHLPSLNNIASSLLSKDTKIKIGIENGGLLRLDVTSLDLGNATLVYHLLQNHLWQLAG